jgi:hypothetical protein
MHFFRKWGEALNAMKNVGFKEHVESEEEYGEKLKWLEPKGMEVVTGIEFGMPA